ncbi:ABC transporter substrate-binding protein [Georgenia sp. H159]|uniref:ABC transporter substrate-binding protein n=1 Tax=Georgenia sp. H159 TaxID=3076115 RepID=UPI002D798B54|nr:ABC transporter substrate-binding protein [Georgenia sp. H159]
MSIASPLRRPVRLAGAAAVALLALSACGETGGAADADAAPASGAEVTIETNNGEMTVPQDPERVVVLDNTAMETVRDLGVAPVAVPKQLLPSVGFAEWLEDDAILDVGTHREPNLEIINEAEPDLIIGGYRFEEYTEDLSDIAPVVDVAPDDERYVESLKEQTTTLGEIFAAEDVAAQLVADLESAVEEAAAATDGQSVFLAVSSGGKIDNGAGRIGRLLEPLDLVDVFAGEDLDDESVHQDSGLAPETVAQADPDWLIVLDRDAATATGEETTPARQIIEAQEAWADLDFMTEDRIIVLDKDFYKREGIAAYTEAFTQIAEAFDAR